jgi:hypothetical protein
MGMNVKIKTVMGLLVITAVLCAYRVCVHELKKCRSTMKSLLSMKDRIAS